MPIPAVYESFASAGETAPAFGLAIREEFLLNFEHTTYCNHGSYGVCPKRVVKYKHALFEEMESDPDYWFRLNLRPRLDDSLAKVANFVGADQENVVFVPNATYGINVVLKSIPLETENEILCTNHTYFGVSNTIDAVASNYDADVLSIDLDLPIKSEDDIVAQFRQTCETNRSIRVAVVDHISSCSAMVFPVKKIAQELSKLGVVVVIDGAHAPGHLDLDLEDLGRAGVSFYVGNFHKWAFAPRGCGFLWTHPNKRGQVKPLVNSNLYKKGYHNDFFMLGTSDTSNFLAAPAALNFIGELGGLNAIKAYVCALLEWAQQMLAETFGTEALQVPKSMEAPFMKVVALPNPQNLPVQLSVTDEMIKEVIRESAVVAATLSVGGQMYLRVSGSVYNVKEDYFKLRDAIAKMLGLTL